MRKLLLLLSVAFTCQFASAQVTEMYNRKPLEVSKEFLKNEAKYHGARKGSRGSYDTISRLSFASFTRGIEDQSEGFLTNPSLLYPWDVNRNFPPDSIFSLKYGAVLFDSLPSATTFDGQLNAPYFVNRSASKLYIDSVYVNCNYNRKNNAVTDTLYIYVFDVDNVNRSFPSGDIQNTVSSFLFVDTMYLTGPLTGPSIFTGGLGTRLTRPVQKWLAKGKSFGVAVQFVGSLQNDFTLYTKNIVKPDCQSGGMFTPAWVNNSFCFLNLKQGNGGADITGPLQSWNGISFTSPTIVCKHIPFGSLWIEANVKDSVDFSCVAIPNQHLGYNAAAANIAASEFYKVCKGDQTKLFCIVAGNTTQNVTYKWSSAVGLDDSTLAVPTFTHSVGNKSYTVTITEGSSTAVCGLTIQSRSIGADLGADKTIPCLTTTAVNSVLTGFTTTGNTYAWSTGETTKNVSNKDVGTYTVTVTNVIGCSATASVKVLNTGVNNTLNFTNSGTGVIFCQNRANTIANTSTEKSGWDFAWSAAGVTTTTDVDGKVVFPATGNVALTLSATRTSDQCKAIPVTKTVAVKASNDPLCKNAISNIGANTSVNIFPIPTSSAVNVEITNLENNAVMTVVDVMGNVIESKSIGASSFVKENVSFENRANGIYFIKIESANEKTIQRIVVEK